VTGVLPVRFRVAGAWLREYREAAGLELQDAASALGCDRSKVSRIEAGERGIPGAELGRLLDLYDAGPEGRDALIVLAGLGGAGGWWDEYRLILGPGYRDIAAAEYAARGIALYAPLRVPELLQDEDGARAAADADPCAPAGIAGIAASAAMARQDAILHRKAIPARVVIGEAALTSLPGSARRAQARHLLGLTARCAAALTVRLLPLPAAGGAAGGAGAFTLLRFSQAPAPGLALIDGPAGYVCLHDPGSVTAYHHAFTSLEALALPPEDTARVLTQMAGPA
jgi:transcriptional regulator with XRE-family HTH domain